MEWRHLQTVHPAPIKCNILITTSLRIRAVPGPLILPQSLFLMIRQNQYFRRHQCPREHFMPKEGLLPSLPRDSHRKKQHASQTAPLPTPQRNGSKWLRATKLVLIGVTQGRGLGLCGRPTQHSVFLSC